MIDSVKELTVELTIELFRPVLAKASCLTALLSGQRVVSVEFVFLASYPIFVAIRKDLCQDLDG